MLCSADAKYCGARDKSYYKGPMDAGKSDLSVQPFFKKMSNKSYYYNYFPKSTLLIFVWRGLLLFTKLAELLIAIVLNYKLINHLREFDIIIYKLKF